MFKSRTALVAFRYTCCQFLDLTFMCVVMLLHNGHVEISPIWAPTNPAGEPSRVRVPSQFNIDCRHYGDRQLDIECLVDINKYKQSSDVIVNEQSARLQKLPNDRNES